MQNLDWGDLCKFASVDTIVCFQVHKKHLSRTRSLHLRELCQFARLKVCVYKQDISLSLSHVSRVVVFLADMTFV